MKKTILLFGVFLASFAFAQVSISGNSADTPQATLDIKAMEVATQPDGILIPRLARTKAEGMGGTIQESTMIYIDAIDGTPGTKTADVDTKGFYYFDGTKWVKVGAVKEGTFTRNVRSDNRATVVVDQLQDGTTATKDYFIRLNGSATAINMPAIGGSNVGRILCFYSETSGSNITINPQPMGAVQSVQPGQTACFISDGSRWINSNGY